MHRIIIALSAALLLCAMASHAPVFAQEQGGIPFKVFRIKGSINVMKPDGTYRKIKKFQPGDELEVGGDGLVMFTGGDDPKIDCTCGPSTNVGNTEENGVPVFRLKKGSAFCNIVGKAKRQGITFKIKTDVGVTGVNGTAFLTTYNEREEEMRTAVTESSVLFSDDEGKSAALTQDQEGIIQRWEKALFKTVGTGKTEPEARAAAVRSMAELLRGVVISGTTQVRDLAAGRVRVTAQLNAFIDKAAATTFGRPSRGTIEARMTLDPIAVKEELGKMAGRRITDTYMLRAQTGFSAEVDSLIQTLSSSLNSRGN